jgi:hypothetical protein
VNPGEELNNKSIYLLGAIALIATMALVSWPTNTVTAADPKNGWGEATSEEAGEEKQGKELGEHASDPNNDGPGNDDRSGLGNTADALTGEKNPDDLGKLLDCADGDDEGDKGSIPACQTP